MRMRHRRVTEDDTFFISFTDAISALLGIVLFILIAVLVFHFDKVSRLGKDVEREARRLQVTQETLKEKTDEVASLDQRLSEALHGKSLTEREMGEQLLAARVKSQRLEEELRVLREPADGAGNGGLLASLEIPGDTLFSSGSSALTRNGARALRQLAEEVRKHPRFTQDPTSIVVVEGFTDDQRVGARSAHRSNWHLSADRASVVTEHLIKDGGIPSNRIAAAGFAEYYPRRANLGWSEKQNRASNRYVKLVLISRATLLEEDQSAESNTEPP